MNYSKYKDDVYIHVLNTDKEPENHMEVEKIRHLVPVSNVKGKILEPLPDFNIDYKYQENLDNAQILRLIHPIGCQYPIMMEDDALPAENWVDAVLIAIKQIEDRNPKPWFLVKLYVARMQYPPLYRRGINSYHQEWNTVAMLMNPALFLAFADAEDDTVEKTLQAKNHGIHRPKDELLNVFAANHGLVIESYEPVIFQHTGIFSSVVTRDVDVSAVDIWYMHSSYFESEGVPITFDPSTFHSS